jgi:Glu-tRNA(Gln) amidotransferase subunit E-like FAD-binding protein
LAELSAAGLTEEPAQTIMRTEPLDQAGLHGVLQRLRNLGLELLEIRTAPDIEAASKVE